MPQQQKENLSATFSQEQFSHWSFEKKSRTLERNYPGCRVTSTIAPFTTDHLKTIGYEFKRNYALLEHFKEMFQKDSNERLKLQHVLVVTGKQIQLLETICPDLADVATERRNGYIFFIGDRENAYDLQTKTLDRRKIEQSTSVLRELAAQWSNHSFTDTFKLQIWSNDENANSEEKQTLHRLTRLEHAKARYLQEVAGGWNSPESLRVKDARGQAPFVRISTGSNWTRFEKMVGPEAVYGDWFENWKKTGENLGRD